MPSRPTTPAMASTTSATCSPCPPPARQTARRRRPRPRRGAPAKRERRALHPRRVRPIRGRGRLRRVAPGPVTTSEISRRGNPPPGRLPGARARRRHPGRAGPARMEVTVPARRRAVRRDGIRRPTGLARAASPLKPGPARVAVKFINDFYDPDNPDPNRRDRNLYVEGLEINGPLDVPEAPRPKRTAGFSFARPRRPNPGVCGNNRVRVHAASLSAPAAPEEVTGWPGASKLPSRKVCPSRTASATPSASCWSRPGSCSGWSRRRRLFRGCLPARRLRAGVAPFLFPVEQHAGRGVVPAGGAGAVSRTPPPRCADAQGPKALALVRNFTGQGCSFATWTWRTRPRAVPAFTPALKTPCGGRRRSFSPMSFGKPQPA